MVDYFFLEEAVDLLGIESEELTLKCINEDIPGAFRAGLQKKWIIPKAWVLSHNKELIDGCFDYENIHDYLKKVSQLIRENEELIEQCINFVKEFADNNNDGHNLNHLYDVMKFSLLLHIFEGGNVIVLIVASILHDIHRYITDEKGNSIMPQESVEYIKSFVNQIGLIDKEKKIVFEAVAHHEDYHFDVNDSIEELSIESKIIQDADNLDAMGAIGIFRCIKYGCSHGIPDYDSSVSFYQINPYYDSFKEASSIHHMNNKLIRLPKTLNTKTARLIGIRRNVIVRNFIDEYIEETELIQNNAE